MQYQYSEWIETANKQTYLKDIQHDKVLTYVWIMQNSGQERILPTQIDLNPDM